MTSTLLLEPPAAAIPTIRYGDTEHLLHYKHLISDKLWDELTALIVREYGHKEIDLPLANLCLDQCLAYLTLCATPAEEILALQGHPDLLPEDLATVGDYAMAELPDCGWHPFIIHTVAYTRFCNTTAGRYIHHVPNSPGGQEGGKGGVGRTVRIMRALGLRVNDMLWLHSIGCNVQSRTTGCFDAVSSCGGGMCAGDPT